jgi:dihydrolipoamide dehydrogenase
LLNPIEDLHSLISQVENKEGDTQQEMDVTQGFDYDLVIIGAGVGGHGAALQRGQLRLENAIIEASENGRNLVLIGLLFPQKALLAASVGFGSYATPIHLKSLGIHLAMLSLTDKRSPIIE